MSPQFQSRFRRTFPHSRADSGRRLERQSRQVRVRRCPGADSWSTGSPLQRMNIALKSWKIGKKWRSVVEIRTLRGSIDAHGLKIQGEGLKGYKPFSWSWFYSFVFERRGGSLFLGFIAVLLTSVFNVPESVLFYPHPSPMCVHLPFLTMLWIITFWHFNDQKNRGRQLIIFSF